ncbi:MBL fold metallo-hydrolase [Diaphorobacter sp. JS3050]|uniref:MBL fold metallo-hydrolase n=1 Tax=unclassified Diaphorobacter TaxID=2649760 RepID=UPI0015517465|nr:MULTISPECIES: MBL fold metallo-hydrolase [unclassified Diaphorobacter]QJY32914.1 MBL fold metallo-hydrolase [Diaphorobacter sp. JS3050]QPN32131.1 MBL fold metallo-hydrolase [Diaphorobacter sp. JS3051]
MPHASMHIEPFFDPVTGTVSYVLADTDAGQAAVIDPVLDFEPKSGTLTSASSDRIIEYVRRQGWQVQWILETHAHADHLSGAQHIRHHLGGKVAIGAHIRAVQQLFRSVFHFERSFLPDGSQFDHLFEVGETFHVGGLELTALHVPGHTPADMAYRVGDDVFVGDTLFMPDVGTARADFPGGDAATLYRSIQRLLALPAHTRLHMCHDYPPENRAPAWVSTVAEQRSGNIHVHEGVTEAAFVQMRTARDATLAMPTLILPSVQVNVRAGKLPPAQDDGRTYIQLPINAFLKGAGAPQGMS